MLDRMVRRVLGSDAFFALAIILPTLATIPVVLWIGFTIHYLVKGV